MPRLPPTNPPDPGAEGPPIPLRTVLRRLAALAWSHKLVALPSAILTVALQLMVLFGLAAQGLAIDLIRRRADPAAPDPRWPLGLAPAEGTPFSRQILFVIAFVLGLALVSAAMRFGVRVCDERFVQACVVDLRTRLYKKLQRLSFRYFDTHDTGQIINRLTADAQSVREFIQGIMIRSAIALAALVVFVVFMVREHPALAVACLAPLPVQVLVMARWTRRSKPMYLDQARLVDVLIRTLQESIAGVRVIRAFGQEHAQQRLFEKHAGAARDHRMAIARDQSRFIPAVQACNIAALAVLLGFGGYLVILGPLQGGIALGTLWIFRGLLEQLGAQAEAIIQIVGAAPESLAGAERVFKLLDLEEDVAERPAAALPAGGITGRVEFQNVSFAYRHPPPVRGEAARAAALNGDAGDARAPGDADRIPVLRDISFTALPGETIAIVGPVGSGKSTLLSLIARFHDPDSGRILIDGADIRDLPLESLRRAVGYVFQEPFLFSNTIAANIAFGRPEAEPATIHAAAEAAAADEFIGDAEHTWDTIVGERGVSLSGGQRQRLTIARALLIRPPILILDDATGAVDALTESRIQRSLDEFMRGRTTFIVAHRLSTLRRADRIIVMDKGRIVDIGTHDELLHRPGHYRAAALIQLSLQDEQAAPEAQEAQP